MRNRISALFATPKNVSLRCASFEGLIPTVSCSFSSEKSEQFLFEESWRLEQAAALMGRAREFLKEQRVLAPLSGSAIILRTSPRFSGATKLPNIRHTKERILADTFCAALLKRWSFLMEWPHARWPGGFIS
jgi:hypothetical protein